jgi:hypothetical protein
VRLLVDAQHLHYFGAIYEDIYLLFQISSAVKGTYQHTVARQARCCPVVNPPPPHKVMMMNLTIATTS